MLNELKNKLLSKNVKYRPWTMWAISVAFVLLTFGIQTAYAVINPYVARSFSLSLDQVATIAAVFTWVYAFAQLFSGTLLDAFGIRRVILSGMLVVFMSMIVFFMATSYSDLIIAQILCSIGSSVGFIGAAFTGGKCFGMKKYAFMFALTQFALSTFAAFGQIVLGSIIPYLSWHELTLAGIIGSAALLFVAFLFLKDKTRTLSKLPVKSVWLFAGKNFISVLKVRQLWLLSFVGGAYFGTELALGLFWAPKIVKAHNLHEGLANISGSLIWIGLAIGAPTITKFSEKIDKRRILIIGGGFLQFISLFGLIYLPIHNFFIVSLLCFIFGFFNATHMLTFAMGSVVVSNRSTGASAAMINGAMNLFGGLILALPFYIYTKNISLSATNTWPLLLGVGIAALLSFFLKETKKHLDDEEQLSQQQ